MAQEIRPRCVAVATTAARLAAPNFLMNWLMQLFANLLVGHPLCQEQEHFTLAIRKVGDRVFRTG